ncbi:MAG: phosphomannomutase [Candidatus Azotimanducaceae bacterium]|jgi:phosphomannomutase
MKQPLSAFRLGDVRGLFPEAVDEAFACAFGHALVHHFNLAGNIAVGRDMRESSPALHDSLVDGLLGSGLNVIDLGLCATELGYFASTLDNVEAAIVVTASHNPPDYNGFKVVLKNGKALTYNDGLFDIMKLMLGGHTNSKPRGAMVQRDIHGAYMQYLQARFSTVNLSSDLIALNGLNGTAATLADDISQKFELPVQWFRRQPGPIPSEGADPSQMRLLAEMKAFMQKMPFALGVAWDGDCDRCVFFDGDGNLAPTYYIIGLLAEHHLQARPGAAVVFDTKLCWNTLNIIQRYHGRPVRSETGHAFMKGHMRNSQAVYGGELSSHHYFGDFFGCDSGMLAWLKIIEILNHANSSLGELMQMSKADICCTPEINLKLNDVDAAFERIMSRYGGKAQTIDSFDGPSFDMPGDWRFTLRRSKTEPLVRLNLEARGNKDRLLNEGGELLQELMPYQADDSRWLDSLYIQ